MDGQGLEWNSEDTKDLCSVLQDNLYVMTPEELPLEVLFSAGPS